MPPTLKALLATRLDQLDEAERRVLERGSVEGEIFHRGAVQALAPRRRRSRPGSPALVRTAARPPRPRAAPGRRRLPLPPPADPRRRLRRAPEGGPRRPARALRRLARRARPGSRRARRDRRLPPRAGRPLPGRARAARPRPRRARCRATRRRRSARERPPGLPDGVRAPHPGGRARATTSARPRARARGRMGLRRLSTRGRQHRLRTRPRNAPRPQATAPERCSRARWRSLSRTAGGELADVRRAGGAPAAPRFPSRRSWATHGGSRLLWDVLAHLANFRMQERRRRRRLPAAHSATTASPATRPSTHGLEWPLILGPRPADEAMRMHRRARGLAARRIQRPGRGRRCSRWLGRFDEAWPLAEAQVEPLARGHGRMLSQRAQYLWLIATIEGDRERALPAQRASCSTGSRGVRKRRGDMHDDARARSLLPRPLRGGRALLRQAQAVPPRAVHAGDGPDCRGAASRRAGRARKGGDAGAHRQSQPRRARSTTPWFQGWALRRPRHRPRARRSDRRGARSARAHFSRSGSGRAACPARARVRVQLDALGRATV